MRSVGIIGFGKFGRFMADQLAPYVEVRAYARRGGDDARLVSLADVCACDIVIFSVPSQSLEEACTAAKPFLAQHALIVDVTSVKVRPLEILKRHFPEHEILGTHPIFGPQSGKHGIAGLTIVVCKETCSDARYQAVITFFSDTLALRVMEMSAEEHDREMAKVMALTHFVGRALVNLGITHYQTETRSFRHLVELCDLIRYDSWELYKTIQNENPYAREERERLLAEMNSLEEQLDSNA